MKISKSVLLIISLITALSVTAQRENKTEKAARLEQEFQETVSLVETNQFMVKIDRVFPQGGHDLTRFNPRGEISIKDSIAEGQLPFFGRAYSLPYGEGGGIEFNAPMKDRKIKIEQKKRKKAIFYRFTVPGQNDNYQVSLEITPGGNCNVNLNSNNRANISYTGHILPLETKQAEE